MWFGVCHRSLFGLVRVSARGKFVNLAPTKTSVDMTEVNRGKKRRDLRNVNSRRINAGKEKVLPLSIVENDNTFYTLLLAFVALGQLRTLRHQNFSIYLARQFCRFAPGGITDCQLIRQYFFFDVVAKVS